MKTIKMSNKMIAGLVVAALLAAPLASSAAPRHAPPPFRGPSGPGHFECHDRYAPPPAAHRHHAPPPPPPHHHHGGYHDCDSDIVTDAAVAVGTLALIGLVAAVCAD